MKREEIDPHTRGQVIILQTCKSNWWRTTPFQQMVLKQLDNHMPKRKKINLDPCLTFYLKLTQNGSYLNVCFKTIKLLGGKYRRKALWHWVSRAFFFFFFGYTCSRSSQARIKPAPQQCQCQILNPLCHQGTPKAEPF